MRVLRLCWFMAIGCVLLASLSFPAATAARDYALISRSSGVLVSTHYPRTNVRIEMTVNYHTPGVILDTVGINGAPVGSFSCRFDDAGHVNFQVYDPGTKSDARLPNGWHVISSTTATKANTPFTLRVEIRPSGYQLWLNGRLERTVALGTPLSGQPVYLGDFPGDDQWGEKYNIHPAMTGTVTLVSFGEISTNVSRPTPPAVQGTPAPVPTDSPQQINAGVQAIEDAFRARKLELVVQLTIPARREAYRKVFSRHLADLPRIADLLKTRKLTATAARAPNFT